MAKRINLKKTVRDKREREAKEASTPKSPLGDVGETQRFNADIPAGLHKRFKAKCAYDGADMTEVIITLIENHLNE